MNVKRDDKVQVIAGNHKGKEGVVVEVLPKKNRVLVEGVNLVKKHMKPNAQNQSGGIIEKEASMDVSNVMVVCGSCKKAVKTAKRKEDGNVVRICKSCNKPV